MRTFENAINIGCRATKVVRRDDTVRHRPALTGKKTVRINRRQAVAGRWSHNRPPVNQSVGTWQNDQATIRLTRILFDDTVVVCGVAAADCNEWHSECWHHGLDGTQHAHLGWGSEIPYRRYPNDMRRNELERF